MCQPVSSVDARWRLQSAACEDLVIPRTAMKFGARSFAVAAPSEWNRLPQHICSKQSVNVINCLCIIIIIVIIIIVILLMIIIVANISTFATHDIIRSSECAYDYGRSSE